VGQRIGLDSLKTSPGPHQDWEHRCATSVSRSMAHLIPRRKSKF